MNSIERVKHYSEVEIEASHTGGDGQKGSALVVTPPAAWPQHGEIVFDRVCARYRPELPQVLVDVR